MIIYCVFYFFFSSRRRHTRFKCDWSSDVCSSDLFNLWTLGIFLGTFSFPILSVLGLALVLRVPRDEIHRGVRIHSLLASSACCVITGFLWSWNLVALRLWAAI